MMLLPLVNDSGLPIKSIMDFSSARFSNCFVFAVRSRYVNSVCDNIEPHILTRFFFHLCHRRSIFSRRNIVQHSGFFCALMNAPRRVLAIALLLLLPLFLLLLLLFMMRIISIRIMVLCCA